MSKINLVAVLLILLISCKKTVINEEIYEGDLIIHNQADVEKIKGQKIVQITGDLIIEASYLNNYKTNISDLTSLKNIKKVNGKLKISMVDAVTNIDFLESITEVGGQLGIFSNKNLISIASLKNLESVGELAIVNNNNLISISSIGQIKLKSGGFRLDGNELIEQLPMFKNWIEVPGDVLISNNAALENLSGFLNTTKINGDLEILGNFKLSTLEGLNNLKEVKGNLSIGFIGEAGNKILTSLKGLEKLERVGESLYIVECHVLTNIFELKNLKYVGSKLSIDGNELISSLEGLNNVTNVNSIIIARNRELRNYCAIKSLIGTVVLGINNFNIFSNASNPSIDQIINECK